jgi:hypothetical protein
MRSEELSDTEKRDQLHALIPVDVFKIDNLNKATPAQLKQLKEAIEVAEALQQLDAVEYEHIRARNERRCHNPN